MKTTIFALALAVATSVPLAIAQEVTSRPSPESSPELTVRDKTTNSDPSVSVTTEKTASPTPKSQASPSATKAPSTAKTTPSPTPAPSAPSTASMPAKKNTPEATIREIEEKWEASVGRHDSSVAQAYLADDFRGVSSKGKVMTKANLLSEMKKDTDTYTSSKNGKVDVRVFGGQFAVATGISTEAGKAKDGKDFKRSFRWTDVWVLRKDTWQCVASQAIHVE